jgi:hypothetical protein
VTPACTGPRGGTRKRTRSDVQPPDWPRKGDLVEIGWLGGSIIGIVLEAKDNGWGAPEITLLKDGGGVIRWSSPPVKVLARRRKLRRGVCKRR